MCIRGVYIAIAASGPLTGTLLITLRKFVSLVLSIIYFSNPWTQNHWMGTTLVFGGVLVYGLKPTNIPDWETVKHVVWRGKQASRPVDV